MSPNPDSLGPLSKLHLTARVQVLASLVVILSGMHVLAPSPAVAQSSSPPALPSAQSRAPSGTIRGSILDASTNEAIVSAQVILLDTSRGVVSALNGTFELVRVTPGEYVLEARMLGYRALQKDVVVLQDRITVVVFALMENPLELDEALIESVSMVGTPSSRLDIPGSVHVLTSRALEKFRYADIHRILRQIPGVNVQEEDGYGLRPNIGMRGVGSERSAKITVMEDGILMAPAPYSAPAAYYFPTVGRAEQVEVRKGSSQIMYGPYTTGGAINLISRSIPSAFSGMLSTTAGTNAARVYHGYAGSSSKNFGFVLEGYEGQTDGFKRLDVFGNVDQPGNTGFDKTDYLAKFRVNTSPSASIYQALEIKLSRTDEVSNETYVGLTASDFARSPSRRYAGSGQDVLNATHKQISLTHTVRPSASTRITTSAYRITFHRNWFKLDKVASSLNGNAVGISDILRDPELHADEFAVLTGTRQNGDNRLSVKANNRDYLSRGIQTNASSRFVAFGASHKLNVGLRLHSDEMDRFQWVDNFIMTDTGMQLFSAGTPGTDSNRIESATAFSAYVQQDIEYGRFRILPGLRYERVKQRRTDYGKEDPERAGTLLNERSNTIDAFIPGFGISGRINAATRAFAGVHKGFSPPGSREGTEPESSVNYEVGVRHQGSLFSGEVTFFMNDYSNLLGTDLAASGGTGSGDLFNGGKVDVSGIEVAASYNLGQLTNWLVSIPVSLSFTHTSAIFRNEFESDYKPWGSVQEGDHLPYIPGSQFSFDIGVEGRRFDLELGTSYVGEMRTQAGQGRINANERTDSHFVLDLSGGVNVSPTVRIFASLRNITDAVYIVARRPAGLRPGLPRTVLAGVTARF